jgi:hypothetical protein
VQPTKDSILWSATRTSRSEWLGLLQGGQKVNTCFCDDCGDEILTTNSYAVSELPMDIDSANEGESATLCYKCFFRMFGSGDLLKDRIQEVMVESDAIYDKHKKLLQDCLMRIEDLHEQLMRSRASNTDLMDWIIKLREERNEIMFQRDEARLIAADQYAKHHNGDEEKLKDNFFASKGWKKYNEFFVGDDDHAKEGL